MSGPLFTDTVTVYNRVRTGRTDVWYRTVLTEVQIQQKVINEVSSTGEATYYTETRVTIPFRSGYTAPENYNGTGWTLRREDVIVLGECTDVVTTTGETPKSIDDIVRDHAGVLIKEATDNTRRPHIRTWKARCV